MTLLIVDAQRAITNETLYRFEEFVSNVKLLIDAAVKCGFEHGFRIIVPEYSNSTFDNEFMTAEESYKYYNRFMWSGRYADCISMEETLCIIDRKAVINERT